jgi:hypothetical protein
VRASSKEKRALRHFVVALAAKAKAYTKMVTYSASFVAFDFGFIASIVKMNGQARNNTFCR